MITPLEIKEKRFHTGLGGFKKKEVIDFLEILSSEFQTLLKGKRELEQRLEQEMENRKELIDRESMIKSVLMTAQENSEKILQNANREAELLIKEAEFKGEKIIEEVEQKKHQLFKEFEDTKVSYKEAKAKILATLDMHRKLLEEDAIT